MFDDSVLFLLRWEKRCSARACSKLAGAGNTLWIKDADSEVYTEKESKVWPTGNASEGPMLSSRRGDKLGSARACRKLAEAGNILLIEDADSGVYTEKES